MKRWLLVPLLLPLAAALAVALLNLRVPARLRLLIWTSPPLPLGTWVDRAGGGVAAAALLVECPELRHVSRNPDEPRRRRTRRPMDPPEEPLDSSEAQQPFEASEPTAQAPPERSPHEAPPTVAVPFRVVQRSASAPASASSVDDWNDAADDDW